MSTKPGQKPESVADLIKLLRVTDTPLPDGDTGGGLKFHTNRGEFSGIVHKAENSDRAVIWVCGARGGFGGPGPGTYARLSEQLTRQGITSLRLDYRFPNDLLECVMDLLAAVTHLRDNGYGPVVVVGHSFGGAVVIAAGAASDHIKGVVSLSPQTYGAGMARQVAPRKLLVAHGKADTRLPFSCALQIYEWAQEPKELVLFEGAEHRLEECRDELETLLSAWIPATLDEEIEVPAAG
jgi:alpha-beta hydrolase superfamily lysophospholipase